MEKPNKKSNTAAQYSNMAFQLAASIGFCTYLGTKLDAYFQNITPYYTVFLGLFGVLAGLYLAIKDFIK